MGLVREPGLRVSAEAVTRDAAWVQREYGSEKWPRILHGLDELREIERAPLSLARVVGRLTRLELEARGAPTRMEEFVASGEHVYVPAAAALAAEQSLVVETIIEAVTPETQAIVEMGSGWGHNLFRLWLEGGPADVRYVAAEYTEAGREASRQLGEIEPRMKLEVEPFDYHNPEDFSLGELSEAIIFSVNSIEQIPELRPEVVTRLSTLADRVRCFHFEPVGWQVHPDNRASSRRFAEQHDYNRNLVSLLQSAADAGEIELDEPQAEIIGVNPRNATTLISWSSISRPV